MFKSLTPATKCAHMCRYSPALLVEHLGICSNHCTFASDLPCASILIHQFASQPAYLYCCKRNLDGFNSMIGLDQRHEKKIKEHPRFRSPGSPAQNVPVALRSGFGSSMAGALHWFYAFIYATGSMHWGESCCTHYSLLIAESIKYLVSLLMSLSVH